MSLELQLLWMFNIDSNRFPLNPIPPHYEPIRWTKLNSTYTAIRAYRANRILGSHINSINRIFIVVFCSSLTPSTLCCNGWTAFSVLAEGMKELLCYNRLLHAVRTIAVMPLPLWYSRCLSIAFFFLTWVVLSILVYHIIMIADCYERHSAVWEYSREQFAMEKLFKKCVFLLTPQKHIVFLLFYYFSSFFQGNWMNMYSNWKMYVFECWGAGKWRCWWKRKMWMEIL